MDQSQKNEIGPFELIPSCLCGSLDLCGSASSAIPLRFAHLNIRVLILFRISCFVFRISSSLCSLCPLWLFRVYSWIFVVNSLCALVALWPALNYAKQSQFQNGQYDHKYSNTKGLYQRTTSNDQRTLPKTNPIKANFKHTNSLLRLPDSQ